jgi:hypothetical protein
MRRSENRSWLVEEARPETGPPAPAGVRRQNIWLELRRQLAECECIGQPRTWLILLALMSSASSQAHLADTPTDLALGKRLAMKLIEPTFAVLGYFGVVSDDHRSPLATDSDAAWVRAGIENFSAVRFGFGTVWPRNRSFACSKLNVCLHPKPPCHLPESASPPH